MASSEELQQCVKAKMHKMADEDLTQKQKLGKAFGICKDKKDFDIIHDFMEDISKMPGSKHQKQGPSKPSGTGKVKVKKSTRKVAGKTVAVEAHERTVKRAKPEVKTTSTRKKAIAELKTSLAQTAEKIGGVKKQAGELEAELISQLPKSELKKREKAQEQKFKQLSKTLETIQSKNQKQAQLHLLSQEVTQFGTTRNIITAMAPFVRILVKMMQGKEPTGSDIAGAIKRVKTNTKIDRKKKEAIIKKMESISGQLDKLKFNDFLVYDSFDSLVAWVLKNISDAKTESEAREIAFAIINSKKKSKKKEETPEEGWKKTWEKIGTTFITQRAARSRLREQRKGAVIQSKRSLYGTIDLTEDAARMARSKFQREGPSKPAKTTPIRGKASSLFEQIQALIPSFFGVGAPTEITRQIEMENTETGQKFMAEIVEELDKNIIQMTPVSSSNVKAVGQFGNEALIQFHETQGTYRFKTDSPEMAKDVTMSLINTASPGRWVWNNIRGHSKGDPTGIDKVPWKYGPALMNPSHKVIGGTTASLIKPYAIAGRTPVKKIQGFDKLVKKLKRMQSSPTMNPQTGSAVESQLIGAEIRRVSS